MNAITSYPQHLSWENKVFTMPNIPRSDKGQIAVLKSILTMVKEHTPQSQMLSFPGSSSKISLSVACTRLRPMRFVIKTANGWELTSESEYWLKTGDNIYLAAFLCANIKFLGEILFYLDQPKTASQLQEIARCQYGLTWKTKSDINSRLYWLRNFGFVEFQEFSLLYSRTEAGTAFLQELYIEKPVNSITILDDTIGESAVPVSDWAIELAKADNSIKKPSIGYIPGGMLQFDQTLFEYIQLIGNGTEDSVILDYSQKTYQMAPSSVRGFMTTLSNFGVVSRLTDVMYTTTNVAQRLMEHRYTIDLLCVIHAKCKFVFEMLSVLRTESLTNKELAAKAKVSYGFERESIDEIRKRILMLKAAKLLRNVGADKYIITERGIRLLDLLDLQETTEETKQVQSISQSDSTEKNSLLTELRLAAKDSSNFERLERAVRSAFEMLGFQAEWLGGAGKTDVLLHATGSPQNAYTVTVDAKSTGTGYVTDSLVDFDTILEHKKKHNATYCAIVGGAFQNERLINRAMEHGVALIDIDLLEQLICQHSEVPLDVNAYRKLFSTAGVANIQCVDEDRRIIIRNGNLLQAVMDCLAQESDDPVTCGLLQERDIYRSLRNNGQFDSAPSLEEISSMLNFLASPFIGCVEKVKDGYYSVGTLKDAYQKFAYFASMCIK